MDKKIKVVWICSFSNSKMRERLNLKPSFPMKLIGKLLGKNYSHLYDFAIWNTNAIEEMENREDVDLHVVCPVRNLNKKKVCYDEKGVHYYFFREENSNILRFIFHQIFTRYTSKYIRNRKQIKYFITQIQPNIVHVMGAENPFYSLSILDVPHNIPTIVQLQALLDRIKNNVKDKRTRCEYSKKGLLERLVINRADYIGTPLHEFKDYVLENIKPNANFLNITLAMGNKIDLSQRDTQYDFVYLAADISKAGIEAIEAFAIAHKTMPSLTLDIVGGFDERFKNLLDNKIVEYNLTDVVTFEGMLPTHDDVIKQIRKSRFALLPLKMDLVPTTLREMMANGLGVVTTITDGTPDLNKKRESVLLSKQGDYKAMANNMIMLVNDEELQMRLIENAAKTEQEYLNNSLVIEEYCEAYRKCLDIQINKGCRYL